VLPRSHCDSNLKPSRNAPGSPVEHLLRVVCQYIVPPAVLAAAGLALILAASDALASVALEVKAISGVQAPGAAPGMILYGFGNAVVNESGEVAFLGFVGDPVLQTGGSGIFGPDAAGELQAIAFDFESVPDLPPDTEFRFNNSTYHPRLNDAGELVFYADLSGPGIQYPTDSSGIWRWSAENGLERVVRAGDPFPEAGPGIVLGSIWGALAFPTIADANIGFVGTLDDPATFSSEMALFTVDPDGALTLLAPTGMAVPGVPGAAFTYPYPGSMNPLGEWSFAAYFEGPGVIMDEDDSANFHWDPAGALTMRVRAGDPAPGTPPGVIFAWEGTAYPNAAGDFAYLSWLAGPGVGEGNDSALYGPDASGDLVLLAREGDPAPGTESGSVFGELHFTSSGVVINANGQVAVGAGLTGPAVTAANEYGIWLSDPTTGALALRARQGDPAPELPGLTLNEIWYPILNDPGDLVFWASVEGPGVTPDTDQAIFVIDSGGGARIVVREGDLASFGPGDLRPLTGFSMLDGTLSDVPGVGQLSNSGHLVFFANAPDGTNAIVVATLPEPSVFSGLAAGLLLLAWLPRPRACRT
jgi:hypothetical protein